VVRAVTDPFGMIVMVQYLTGSAPSRTVLEPGFAVREDGRLLRGEAILMSFQDVPGTSHPADVGPGRLGGFSSGQPGPEARIKARRLPLIREPHAFEHTSKHSNSGARPR
jgi:hypothetical protein